jgi:hypothetical protein
LGMPPPCAYIIHGPRQPVKPAALLAMPLLCTGSTPWPQAEREWLED